MLYNKISEPKVLVHFLVGVQFFSHGRMKTHTSVHPQSQAKFYSCDRTVVSPSKLDEKLFIVSFCFGNDWSK